MLDSLSQKEAKQAALKLGLTAEEYENIETILARIPNFTELSVFAVMWSEHCSYKNSIKWLKTLPREGRNLLVGAGEENAGLVDIGDGYGCAFKIESHNHPSAIEPYQGAATGVGGIHRDIFTMGARPIAALNSLRFGDIKNHHTQHLIKGVVKGIGDYGNCLGVPTIGGEVYFNSCYNQNILVNAMSIGVVKKGETISATATGIGNPVFIVGSATGKDGIHGATFASADLTEDSAEDLPAVQVGDPFQEKLLLEASLEIIRTGAVIGMQDMGAAGITCSTSEMSAKGGVGMRIDLDLVPKRQANMQAFEILLSESQERMLIVGKKGLEHLLYEVFDKWDLECQQIGEITAGGSLEYYHHGHLVAEVPAHDLVLGGGAPVYSRAFTRPKYLEQIDAFDLSALPVRQDIEHILQILVSSPNIASKRWIYEQYDSTVRTNTMVTNQPSDAAVIRIKETGKGIASTVDCNSVYVHANPYQGAMIAVAEAARNLVCSGAYPLAITNNLNFGNPYDPEVYWQFVEAVKGMGDACRFFDTPVTGGNVSFYNQAQIKGKTIPIYPTPTIGMIGLLEDLNLFTGLGFKQVGDTIILIGPCTDDIGSSEYVRLIHKAENTPAPYFVLEEEGQVQAAVGALIRKGWIQSAHDVSEGGLLVTLLEKSFVHNIGFEVRQAGTMAADRWWFGEGQSRIVITTNATNVLEVTNFLTESGVNFAILGMTKGDDHLLVEGKDFGPVSKWKKYYDHSIESILEH